MMRTPSDPTIDRSTRRTQLPQSYQNPPTHPPKRRRRPHPHLRIEAHIHERSRQDHHQSSIYSFNNAFLKTPVSQLISGQGQRHRWLDTANHDRRIVHRRRRTRCTPTRMGHQSLDDELAEVWCPSYQERPSPPPKKRTSPLRAASRLVDPLCTLSREDNFLVDLDWACRDKCREAAREAACHASFPSTSSYSSSTRSTSYSTHILAAHHCKYRH